MKLYAHPFASYCQKVLIALYENDMPFEYRPLIPEHADAFSELETLWPLKLFPVLVDGGHTVIEASIIIEYLQVHHPGPVRLIPDDPRAAIESRFMDRVFDNYIATPQGKFVFDSLRPAESRDPLELRKHARDWRRPIVGSTRLWRNASGLQATSSASPIVPPPSLFYADWTHPVPEHLTNLRSYRRRLLARPSFACVVEEARPYRHLFPLGAPDRD